MNRYNPAEAEAAAAVLPRILDLARGFLESVDERPVKARGSLEELRASLGAPLADEGVAPLEVVETLARGVEPGLVSTAGPRYFGFVIGGSLPAALAADWLAAAWDQNAGLYATSPAASVVEEVAAGWLRELLDVPAGAGVGFVTGCQMANFTGLCAARYAVLRKVGWDVEEQGLQGAPVVDVVVGDEAHVTIFTSLRMLGLGSGRARRVKTDDQGRMIAEDLRRVLRDCEGPTIVCAQAGNVNTGAFDPLEEVVAAAHERGAWVHIDGAFGLWAAASPRLRHLVHGSAQADSWATDGHKWLNVPYDCGIVMVADAAAQRAAMRAQAAYLVQTEGVERDPAEWVPEFSRRARGFAVYAALRSLGRRGVAEMIERGCRLAARMAERLAKAPGVQVLNDVVLNQVLVRFTPPRASHRPSSSPQDHQTPTGGDESGVASPLPPDVADADAFTKAVIGRVQQGGVCWLGGTRWHGVEAMRISVSNWSTTEADIDRSAEAILAAARA